MSRTIKAFNLYPLLALITLSLLLSACGTSIKRIGVNEVHDLSGNWNDTDSRLVSEEMIADVLSRPWLDAYIGKTPPTLIMGKIRNLSHEHINLNTFIGDIERALINSGQVQFVASNTERQQIRSERSDQEFHSSDKTRKEMGQEIGADFMLKGTINTIIDQKDKTSIKFYQIDLTLISISDNRKVWVGQKKIKKIIKRGGYRM